MISFFSRSPSQDECERFLFVHIPKTAGTSFRDALDSHLKMVYDYSQGNPVTSKDVSKYIYQQDNFYDFNKRISSFKNVCIAGHFPVYKYLNLVNPSRIITFLRHPVDQVISHYNHQVKYHNLSCTFEKFISIPKNANLQSRMLYRIPLGLIGFIGITEQYDCSLKMFNSVYNMDLKSLRSNVNDKKTMQKEELDSELLNEILNNNADDLKLYQLALKLLKTRSEFNKNTDPKRWVFSHVQINKKGNITGCAFTCGEEDKAVKLELLVKGSISHQFEAKDFYSETPKARLPRERYVGFKIANKHLPADSEITLRVVETQQVIFSDKLSTKR